jgi:hypothetical protein
MPRVLLDEKNIKSDYQTIEHRKRREVLKDTIKKFSQKDSAERYLQQAQKNHEFWASKSQISPQKVRVVSGDWGDVTRDLSKGNGAVYAVLNMANAYVPGGGYLEGMIAQEENIYRRSNCHFFIHDEEMNKTKSRYTSTETDLINAEFGRVYLDVEHPRVCIKGSEGANVSGYNDLHPEEYFLFYELKSAADDLRDGSAFNEKSMRRKIVAQLETLKEKKITHIVLSAFGCGAFVNPADKVALIYKQELEKRSADFEDVVFAIYNPGYGPNNVAPFTKVLDGLPLMKKSSSPFWVKGEQKQSSEKYGDLSSSSLSLEHIREIKNQISILNKEISSYWPYPNKDRKILKVLGLEALLKKSTQMDAGSAIAQVESEFADIRKGSISTRTADLLDRIRKDRYPSRFKSIE